MFVDKEEDEPCSLTNGASVNSGGKWNTTAINDANPEGDANNGEDPDEKSVFVKNVDFSADETSLRDHFKECLND